MKTCISCGKTIPDNTKFCGFCGAPQEVQAPVQPVAEQPVYQAPVQPVAEQPVYQAPVQPAVEQPVYQAPVQPAVEQPVYQAPVQPAVEQPVYQAPVQPAVEQPQYQQPAYQTPVQPAVQPQYQQPTYQSPIQPAMSVQQGYATAPIANPKPKKKLKPLFIIIPAIVLVLAAVAVCLFLFVFNKKDKDYSKEAYVAPAKTFFSGIESKNFDTYVTAWAPAMAESMRNEVYYSYGGNGYNYMDDNFYGLENLTWKVTKAVKGDQNSCNSMMSDFASYYGVSYSITDGYRLYVTMSYARDGQNLSSNLQIDVYQINGVWYIVDWKE